MADTKIFVLFSILLCYILQSSVAVPLQQTKGEVKGCPNCNQTGNPFTIKADHKGLKHKKEIPKPHLVVSDMENNTSEVFQHSEMKYDTGVYSTICWTKITTVTKNLVSNTTEQTTEFAVSFETPADIPVPYRKPTGDSDGILGTKVSYPWPFETMTTDGFISVKKTREVTCASGPMYIKETKNWPSTGKQRVEIRVMPKNGTLSKCDESNPSKQNADARSSFMEKFKMSSSTAEDFENAMSDSKFGESVQQTPFGFMKMTSMSKSSSSAKMSKKSSKSITRVKSRNRFLYDDDLVGGSPANETSKNHSSTGNNKVNGSSAADPSTSSSKSYHYEITLPKNKKFNLTALLSGSYSRKYTRPTIVEKKLKYSYSTNNGDDDEYNKNVDDSMDTLSKLGKKYKWHKKTVTTTESSPYEEYGKPINSKLVKSSGLMHALKPLFEEAEIDSDSLDDFVHLLKKLANLKKSKKPKKGHYKKVAKITYKYNPRPDNFDSEFPLSHEIKDHEATTERVSPSTESTSTTTQSQTSSKASEDLTTRHTKIATDSPNFLENHTEKKVETSQYPDHSHAEETTTTPSIEKISPSTVNSLKKDTMQPSATEVQPVKVLPENNNSTVPSSSVPNVSETLPKNPVTESSSAPSSDSQTVPENRPVNNEPQVSEKTSTLGPQTELPVSSVTPEDKSVKEQTLNPQVNENPVEPKNQQTNPQVTGSPVQNQDVPKENTVVPSEQPKTEKRVPEVTDSPVQNQDVPKENTVVPSEQPKTEVRVPEVTDSPVQNQDVPKENVAVPSEQPQRPKNEDRVPEVTDSPVQNPEVPKESTVVPSEQPKNVVADGPFTTQVAPKDSVTEIAVMKQDVPTENIVSSTKKPEQHYTEAKVPEVTDSPVSKQDVSTESKVAPTEQPEQSNNKINVPEVTVRPATKVVQTEKPEVKVPEVSDSPVTKQDVVTDKVQPSEQPKQQSEVPEKTTQAAVTTTSVGHPKPKNKSDLIAIRRDDNTLECYQLGDMSFRKKCPEDMSNIPIYTTTNHGLDAMPMFEVDNMDEFIKMLCSQKMQRYLKSKRRPDSALDRYFRKKLTPTVLPSKHVMHEKRNHDKPAITHHKTE